MAYYIMFLWIPDVMSHKVTGHFFVNALHAFHRFNRRYHVKMVCVLCVECFHSLSSLTDVHEGIVFGAAVCRGNIIVSPKSGDINLENCY